MNCWARQFDGSGPNRSHVYKGVVLCSGKMPERVVEKWEVVVFYTMVTTTRGVNLEMVSLHDS